MVDRRRFLLLSLSAVACTAAGPVAGPSPSGAKEQPKPAFELPMNPDKVEPLTRTDAEWKAALVPSAYAVLRQSDTERPFTGLHWNNHDPGTYVCAGCGLALFDAADKFDSGTGWPSYTRPLKSDRVAEHVDATLGMTRTEVRCARCGGHLGHVFPDGPQPTGLRYCMNSVSMVFVPKR